MSLLTRLRKHWRAGIATIVALATLAGGMTVSFAGVGTGDASGGWTNVNAGGDVKYGWFYKESFGSLDNSTVERFFRERNVALGDGSHQMIETAVNKARDSIKARSGGQLKNPRVVGIASMIWVKPDAGHPLEFNSHTFYLDVTRQDWKRYYHQTVDGHDFFFFVDASDLSDFSGVVEWSFH